MVKKIIKSLLISLLIILFSSLFPSHSFAAPNASVIFSTNSTIIAGRTVRVDIYIDSNTDINAAQLKILYPESKFIFNSVDYSASKFTIKAQETQSPGNIIIARGNIQPLKGNLLFATLVVTPQSGASISDFSYAKDSSLVMSTKQINILSGSQVLTQKPITPTPAPKNTKSFTSLFFNAVGEFFHGLFGGK